MFYLLLAAAAIPAYLLGSINGAIITSKYLYRKDIRKYGSGNPGLTNFYRVFGKYGAALVVIIDVMKTVAPVLFGGFIFAQLLGPEMRLFGREFAGFVVMLGHCFPLYYGFSGGKGVMAAGTFLICIDWRLAVASWVTFMVITAATRYVSLGAIIGSAAYPAMQMILGLGGVPELIMASASALLLIIRHHENIRRLLRGSESKLSFRRKDGSGGGPKLSDLKKLRPGKAAVKRKIDNKGL